MGVDARRPDPGACDAPPDAVILEAMDRVTKTAWFGPKRWGWGWSPASWQGWVVTAAFAGVSQLLKRRLPPRRATLASLVLVAAFFGVLVLTGDPPGSRRRAARAAAAATPDTNG